MDELLRPADVARMLGVSRTWLYDAAKDGRIRRCGSAVRAACPIRS
jgi:predicted DNA-binding transcriptional regulator AlpA